MTDMQNDRILKAICGGFATILTTLVIWLFMQQIGAPEKFALKADVCAVQKEFVTKVEFVQVQKQQDERWNQIQKSLDRIERKLP